jgi:ABC-type Fe3+ transport system substrate-binding protein
MSITIDPDATLLAITDEWPETVEVFVAQGFPQMGDESKRRAFGGAISLRMATGLKKLDLDAFVELLEGVVEKDEVGSAESPNGQAPLRVMGLLPCPVRIPLEEAFEEFAQEFTRDTGRSIVTEFQAASVGASWMDEHVNSIEDPEDFPDLFISAGFETFFDPKGIGKFRKAFADRTPYKTFNPSFDGVDLKDPEGRYAMISVVPAVFLVNTHEFGDEPLPRTWGDLLEPRFEQRVSLPVGDFDLFSGILLDIRRRYGDEGVRKLGRSLLESMHPAQMVKVGGRPKAPMVTIMPYFFTRMARPGSPMQAVWPEDGAIISPIFLLAKASGGEDLQRVVDFFCSKEVGEVLAIKGLFPSTHPEVDNGLAPDAKFSWLSWDWIEQTDIAAAIKECEQLFDEGRNGR